MFRQSAIEMHSLPGRTIVRDQTFTFLLQSISAPLPCFEILGRGGPPLHSIRRGKNAFNGETSSDDPWSLVHDPPGRLYAHATHTHARENISSPSYSCLKKAASCITLPSRVGHIQWHISVVQTQINPRDRPARNSSAETLFSIENNAHSSPALNATYFGIQALKPHIAP